MIPVSAAEKILDGKTFFVSTFLDKYISTVPGCVFQKYAS
jgi:hypothetical protein